MKEVIKIAGAGISGLTAAINLNKFGYPVEIYERKGEIANRFKGDFQGIENWTTKEDALELIKNCGLEINFTLSPSYEFKVCGPKRELKSFTSKRAFYYLIQRGFAEGNLDKGLYNQTLEKDIKIFFDCKELPEDINIFATGPDKASAIILGCNFQTDFEDTHIMLCDNDLAPKGYAYMLIVNGQGTIATAFKKDTNNPNIYLERTVESVQKFYSLNMSDTKRFGTYGSFTTENIYEKNGKYFVGEAAGLQDFLFGFGLRYAILSGYLAAKSITNNLNYSRLATTAFSDTLKASLVNRFMYEQLDNQKYNFIINKLSGIDDLILFLRKRYNFSLKRRLLYPIAKVKQKTF